jgi:N4-gp56 family major capsid protein
MNAANTTLAVLQRNGISQNEYWSKRILEMIKLEKSNFVFTELGTEVTIPLHEGTKTFTARRYNHLPYDAEGKHKLTEGVAPTALKPEAHKVSGVVNQYGVVMEETDVAADVHFDNIKTIYQPELARHAAEVRERNIIDSFTDASEYYVGVGNATIDSIDASDIITFKDCRTVALSMTNFNRRGHRKYNGKFVTVMHPNVMNDLLDDPVLVNKLLVPGNDNTPIKQGTLAKYMAYGMYFTDSLICPVTTNSGSVNVYTSFVLGQDPYMVLSLGSSNVKFFDTGFTADKADPLAQKATFGYKMWTGAKVTDPMAITKIYSASGYDVALADFTEDIWGKAASQATE